jgi:hypothetical protein
MVAGCELVDLNPALKCLTSLLRDFELYRSMSFLLHDDRTAKYTATLSDVVDLQTDQVATPKLAIYR